MQKTSESGRSLVEMLAVLAIIAVLSIGGTLGYLLGMRRYRADLVLDVAAKYASTVYMQFQSYKAKNGGSVVGFTPVTLANSGVSIANMDSINGVGIALNTAYTGGKECVGGICENGVSILMSFPQEQLEICKAITIMLSVDNTCPDLVRFFPQS